MSNSDHKAGSIHFSIWLGAGLLAVVVVALWSRMLHLPLSHDEHQFVAAGALIEDGLLPYRDFPFHHVPNLALLYAFIDAFSARLFLTSRMVSFLAASASVLLVYLAILSELGKADRPRAVLPALVGVLALFGSPLMAQTSGRAWNHDVPVALALGSLILMSGRNIGRSRAAASGLLAGLAIGSRASFLPFGLVTTVWLLARSESKHEAIRTGVGHVAGLALGLLPTLVSVAAWPRLFFFDNWTYTRLNTVYRTVLGFQDAMSLRGKAAFLARAASDPIHIAVLVMALTGFIAAWIGRGRAKLDRPLAAPLFVFGGLAILAGSLVPTPSWPQYFYDPLPFFVVGAVILGMNWPSGITAAGIVSGLASLTVLAFGGLALADSLQPLIQGSQTTIDRVEGIAREVNRHRQIELVMTLAPIIPLEAGLDILPELASGPFTWRVSPLYSQEPWIDPHVLHPEELNRLRLDPQRTAVLTGFESGNEGFRPNQQGGLEDPFRELAARMDLSPIDLATEFEHQITFWVPGGGDG